MAASPETPMWPRKLRRLESCGGVFASGIVCLQIRQKWTRFYVSAVRNWCNGDPELQGARPTDLKEQTQFSRNQRTAEAAESISLATPNRLLEPKYTRV